jgi:glycosyltransferase involved in cell wall biosynthesis
VEGIEFEIISTSGWRRWLLRLIPNLHKRPRAFQVAAKLYATAFAPDMERVTKGAELIHYIGTGVEMLGYAAQEIASYKRIPFVVEPAMHVGQGVHGQSEDGHWGNGHGDWPLYLAANVVIAHTGFEADELRRNGVKASHVYAVRHGFDALEPGDGERFRKVHGITGRMILFVGRRCDVKGYFTLLDAFAILRQQMPDVTLVIVGPGETPPSKAKGVLELGRVSDQLKQDALSACTVFCMPSIGESFGMAYFEAWNCGKAVVGLDLPVLRETIGASGGGLLAEPGRIDDLVEKLRQLLDEPELATAMGARGKEFAKRHTWSAATDSCLEAYAMAQDNLKQSLP